MKSSKQINNVILDLEYATLVSFKSGFDYTDLIRVLKLFAEKFDDIEYLQEVYGGRVYERISMVFINSMFLTVRYTLKQNVEYDEVVRFYNILSRGVFDFFNLLKYDIMSNDDIQGVIFLDKKSTTDYGKLFSLYVFDVSSLN